MRNIPVNLSGFRLMVSEPPTLKLRQNDRGEMEPVADQNGLPRYVVSLFAKQQGQKGEEIKVTLTSEPADGFDEGALVELVSPQISPYSFKNDRGETISGIAFSAEGLKPLS